MVLSDKRDPAAPSREEAVMQVIGQPTLDQHEGREGNHRTTTG